MSGFSADWLSLREPADAAARAPAVLNACRQHFAGREALSICDLGSGTGAAVTAFAPYLPQNQHWLLVDDDAGNLAAAERMRGGPSVTISTLQADLATNPAPWPQGCGLVTATALFDLAGAAWIERFAKQLAADRLPVLATLTYDGVQVFGVRHPADEEMLTAFNRHQHLDKGLGGPAAGPGGATVLANVLQRQGYSITTAESPWRLDGTDQAGMIAAILDGWAAAVVDAGFVAAETAREWRQWHIDRADALTVGHVDLFAAPA